MKSASDRSSGASNGRARIACREVSDDLVAFHRDELSPLRAESVRAHLASCADCREESLEWELTMRSFQRLSEPRPPAGLVDRTMKRVVAAHGWVEHPSGAGEFVSDGAEPGAGVAEAPPPRPGSVWFRPVRRPLAWAALAAAVLLTTALGFVEPLNDAFGRAQKTILGRRICQVLDRASDAFLEKLRL